MPLHPSLVHLPIGLAVLMPVLAVGFGWAIWTGRVRLRAWIAIVALQTLLLTSGLVALQTGRTEEERVEKVVSEAALETHEDAAEVFLWAVGITVIASALALAMPRPGASKAVIAVSTLMMLGCLALAVRVGHAGGQLVYVNGAASAYVGASGNTAAPSPNAGDATTTTPRASSGGDDDDDRGGRGK